MLTKLGIINPSYQSDSLYFIKNAAAGAFKIGRATDVKHRIKTLQTGSVQELELIWEVSHAGFLEPLFHCLFGEYAIRKEWYLDGSVPVEVMWAWEPAAYDCGSLLHSFGEAVTLVLTRRGLIDDEWNDDAGWADADVSTMRRIISVETASRDEHHRHAVDLAAVCSRIHKEAIEVAALPHRAPMSVGVA